MKIFKIMTAVGLGLFVSACASTDIASRNATIDNTSSEMMLRADPAQQALPAMQIVQMNVVVPQSLRVSEANRYYPSGDIVWRGDPIGNRHAQVKEIFEAALKKTAQAETGSIPVQMNVEVLRFHALTEKARYTTGGVHSITFRVVPVDMRTGLALAEPRIVKADLDGFGGQQAIEADRAGNTQKMRITNHLAEVFRQELVKPGGYENARLGMFQALNKL